MKTKILLVMLCFSLTICAQQKAMFNYSISLSTSDSINTDKWLAEKQTEKREKEFAQKYGEQMYSIAKEYMEGQNISKDDLTQAIKGVAFYKNVISHTCFWHRKQISKAFKFSVKTRPFREYVFDNACAAVCELVAYYPNDYKQQIIRAFSEALEVLNDAPKHKYEIRDADPNDNWEELIFFKDGLAQPKLGHGITGFLLRRVYMDGVPLSEIKEKTTILLNKLKAINASNNGECLAQYTINNDIVYCIGSEMNYFISLKSGKKFVPYINVYRKAYFANVIKCRYNMGQTFYNIGNVWYRGTDENKVVVIDANVNVVYKE